MESILKSMDFLIKHWGSLPRRCPSQFPLITASIIAPKNNWVRHPFPTCNFSFILAGRGEFHRFGKCWPVLAPCVITQWPGEYVEYGPTREENPSITWDELYLIYDSSLMTRFKQTRLIDPERPVWPIANLPAVLAQVEELGRLTASRHPEEDVDRMDRACERLILESLLPAPQQASDESTVVQKIQDELRKNLGKEIDVDALAERYGLSPATFRRRWSETTTLPPAHYRLQYRLREACNLLVMTDQPIKTIAHRVGFADELYFSRRFHRDIGMPPSAYRRKYAVMEATSQP